MTAPLIDVLNSVFCVDGTSYSLPGSIWYYNDIFQTMDDFFDQCEENNVTIISQQVFLYDPLTQVQILKVFNLFTSTLFWLF